jgi:hypothetical protein
LDQQRIHRTGSRKASGEPVTTPLQWTDLRRSEIGIVFPGLQSVTDLVRE